jgi:rubrerythrin
MYKTEANLQAAFAGECQAYVRYTFFATKAASEGLTEYANLFRAIAEAELVHARNHFQVMGGIGSTKENLLAAATSEHYEITRVYPGYSEQASIERNEKAKVSFDYADKAEKTHNDQFEKAMQTLKAGTPASHENYFVCHTCGCLAVKEVPAKCPVCSSASAVYKKVD